MQVENVALIATQMRKAAAALRRQAEQLQDSAQTMLIRASEYESRAAEIDVVMPDLE